jgi:GTP-binding protein
MLCNNVKLAKTSHTPGKTQLINHFEIRSSLSHSPKKESIQVSQQQRKGKDMSWYLVDLPGYGYAKGITN